MTVIALSDVLCGGCELCGVCAISPTVVPSAIVKHAPDQIYFFSCLLGCSQDNRRCNCGAGTHLDQLFEFLRLRVAPHSFTGKCRVFAGGAIATYRITASLSRGFAFLVSRSAF